MSKPLRPFFSYFGSKWSLSKYYPAPKYRRVVEPFAGGAGYACRHWDRDVVLVEKDPTIAGLWHWLTKVSAAEIRSIPDIHPGQHVDDLAVSQEARWLVGLWLTRCASSPRKIPCSWMREGTRPRSFWGPTIRERIAVQVEQIRHWRVVEGSYENAPGVEATWFVDPPYQVMGKHYRHGNKHMNFEALGAWCQSLPGQVIVCEASGADWLPFETFRTGRGNARNAAGKSHEAIWYQERNNLATEAA